MDLALSHDSLSAIVAIIAPGYLAIRTYSAVYSKSRDDFSQLFLRSVVCGLIIVSIYNGLLRLTGYHRPDNVLSAVYYLPLLAVSPLLGLAVSYLRRWRPLRRWLSRLNLPSADDDYLRDNFRRLPPDAVVLVVLKSGEIFSGTPVGFSIEASGPDQKLTFGNLAWFNAGKRKDQWELHAGSLIISAGEILYIETDKPISR